MKKILLVSVLAMSVSHIATARPIACTMQALQGSWQLQSAVYRDATGKVVAEIKNGSTHSRKLIAGQHFSFITWQPDDSFVVAASGRFSTPAGAYHEQVDVSSLARLRGKTYQFRCELDGDRWLHAGHEDGVDIAEIWQRLPD